MGESHVVVFGAGDFALGGVLGEIRGDISVHVFIRTPQSIRSSAVVPILRNNLQYCLAFGASKKNVTLTTVQTYDSEEGMAQLRKLLMSEETLGLACSVGVGQISVVQAIKTALTGNEMPVELPLFILPCENEPANPHWLELHSSRNLDRRAMVLPTMVDRICNHLRVEDDVVVVDVEEYRELLVEFSDTAAGIESSIALSEILLKSLSIEVSADIERDRTRKILLMNGLQMGLAAFAYKERKSSTTEYFEEVPDAMNVFVQLSEEIALGVSYMLDIPVPDAMEWATKYRNRILLAPDTIERLLRRVFDYEPAQALATVHKRGGALISLLKEKLGKESRLVESNAILRDIIENR